MTPSHRNAFSLIELLVVMLIISVLAGMLFAVLGSGGQAAKRRKTETILGVVQGAIAAAAAQGVVVQRSEHPLAGSSATQHARPQFYRVDGRNWQWQATDREWEPQGSTTVLTALSTMGEALRGVKPGMILAVDSPRILLDSDLFTGCTPSGAVWPSPVPALYGLPRSELGLLGAGLTDAIAWRGLPEPVPGVNTDANGILQGPYDNQRYPNMTHLIAPGYRKLTGFNSGAITRARDYNSGTWQAEGSYGGEGSDVRRSLDTVLVAGSKEELAKLGALYEPPSDDIYGQGGAFLRHRMVYRDTERQNSQTWDHATCQDGSAQWQPYRLRGAGLYDAWGTELLAAAGPRGSLTLTSAGPDGAFRWHPGDDGLFQTPPNAKAAQGDDREASSDNISQ
ncbi:MAG: type II secretion system protein [Planctomycetota bacterium]|jgi:prepilin-type N-terminal cleavage/methylation domain-containing protein|nr:type II secretion system protein [Planctomycetota bacterium]